MLGCRQMPIEQAKSSHAEKNVTSKVYKPRINRVFMINDYSFTERDV